MSRQSAQRVVACVLLQKRVAQAGIEDGSLIPPVKKLGRPSKVPAWHLKPPPLSLATVLPTDECGVLLVVLLMHTCSTCLPCPAHFGVLILLPASILLLHWAACPVGLHSAINSWLSLRSAAAA